MQSGFLSECGARLAEKAVGRPLGDFGEPEDIAEAAAFLASTKSRWVGTWDVRITNVVQ